MLRGVPYRAVAPAAAVLAVVGSIAVGQIAEEEGGARADAGLSFRLGLDNGDPEFRTGFDLDLVTATRERRLGFSGDFGVVVPLDDIEAISFNDPRYGLDYMRDTGRSRFTFSADFSRSDIDDRFIETFDDEFDESIVNVIEGGSEERRNIAVGLEVGLDGPLGAEVFYRFDDRIYTDAADPDLQDVQFEEAAVALRYDVDPSLRLGASTQWTRELTEGANPERDERFRAGVDAMWQIWPELGLSAEIAYARIEVETGAGVAATLQERDGINLRFGAELDRPNGGYTFDAARILYAPGFVSTLDMARNFDLPSSAAVTVTLGLSHLPSGDTYGTGGLRYDRDLRRGAVALSYAHTATLNGDFDEVRRRILDGSYTLDLPRDARLAFSGRLTDSDFLLGEAPDVETARLAINYSRPLTERWDLGAGASWQVTREDGGGEDSDSRLFLSLERSFSIRR